MISSHIPLLRTVRACVGVVLRDHNGDVLLMFSKNVGIKESN